VRRRIEQYLDFPAEPGEFQCNVKPVAPWLNFAFRWQAGYRVRFPLRQLPEEESRLQVAFRVTPEGGEPAYFWEEFQVPAGKRTGGHAGRFSGGFFVGEGRYRVDWVMIGPNGRSCRKKWAFRVKLNARQRRRQQFLSPGAVAPIFFEWNEVARSRPRPYRLAVVLHVSPLFPRSIRVTRFDQAFLATLLISLFENTPFQETALYAVSLEKQEVIFESKRLDSESFRRLLKAMQEFDLGTIGIEQYTNPEGRIDFLADLVNRQIALPEPPDAIVFIGPNTRHTGKFPAHRLERAPGGKPLFFYIHLDYFSWRFPWADLIERLTKGQNGKIFRIRTPDQLAKALDEMEKRIRTSRGESSSPSSRRDLRPGAGSNREARLLFRAPLFRDPEQARWAENPNDLRLRPHRLPRRPRRLQGGRLPGRRTVGVP